MPNDMFMLRSGGGPIGLQQAAFSSELEFQQLLANHPDLLAGSRIDAARPRRWLLVSREAPIPSDASGAARWAIDHLFIDQDCVPTLVEVKRQSDSRIRREVIGQMLDYAANGVIYWPVTHLKERFEARCQRDGTDAAGAIAELVDTEGNPDEFWSRVETNLRAGRVRMLFVADVVPPELRRVVEFLNQQMNPAEVLALELRRFEGDGFAALVPTLFGKTEIAESRKTVGGAQTWTEETFVEKLSTRSPEEIRAGLALMAWVKENASPVWGSGKVDGSVSAGCRYEGRAFNAFSLYTSGMLDLNLWTLSNRGGVLAALGQEWRDRVAAIDGLALAPAKQLLRLTQLTDDHVRQQFIGTLDWLISQLEP